MPNGGNIFPPGFEFAVLGIEPDYQIWVNAMRDAVVIGRLCVPHMGIAAGSEARHEMQSLALPTSGGSEADALAITEVVRKGLGTLKVPHNSGAAVDLLILAPESSYGYSVGCVGVWSFDGKETARLNPIDDLGIPIEGVYGCITRDEVAGGASFTLEATNAVFASLGRPVPKFNGRTPRGKLRISSFLGSEDVEQMYHAACCFWDFTE